MFACLYIPPLATGPSDTERAARGDLASLAREFSPRVEVHGPGLVTIDASGLDRLFGDANSLGQELRRATAERRLPVRIAVASTRTAAWIVAHSHAGLSVVREGQEPLWLSPLPLRVLEQLAANGLGPVSQAPGSRLPAPAEARSLTPEADVALFLATLKRWGLKTLGDFIQLPSLQLSERFGQQGLAWQRMARGEEIALLVPGSPDERFEETLELEWPIEGLQPLSFVFGRLFEALSAHLAERDRAAAVLHVHLHLVTRDVEHRTLQLPAPMREARVLRTLVLLNLEAHPVTAGIDRVTVVAEPVPGRVVQCSLLTRALPFPEQLSTLLARLGAVMGDRRCGMAALVDSHRPAAFVMKPFPVGRLSGGREQAGGAKDSGDQTPRTMDSHQAPGTSLRVGSSAGALAWHAGDQGPFLTIRRFRIPVAASVDVRDGRPVRIATNRQGLRGGPVNSCAGPWRTSGEWWRVSNARVQRDDEYSRAHVGWNRDEWDVHVADGGVYRIYRDRDRDRWFVDGIID